MSREAPIRSEYGLAAIRKTAYSVEAVIGFGCNPTVQCGEVVLFMGNAVVVVPKELKKRLQEQTMNYNIQ